MRLLDSRLALAPLPFVFALRLAACAAGDTSEGFVDTDGGDATAKDARADTATVAEDAGIDAEDPIDATARDAANDVTVDAATEAAADAANDANTPVDSGNDSAIADAGSDVRVDAAPPAFPAAPTCDGVLTAGEYPATYATAEGQTVGVSWDDSNLYVALANANISEALVFTLGTAAAGSTTGQPYDNLTPTLPFAANLTVYAKDNYQEVRTFAAGNWTQQNPGLSCFQATGGGIPTREFAVPWAHIGGRPASFNMLNYAIVPSGNTYGVSPIGSLAGSTFSKYFAVAATGPSGVANAFAAVRP